MSINRTLAISRKQFADFFRNPNVLVCALLAPLFALLYRHLLGSAMGMEMDALIYFTLNITASMNFSMVGMMAMVFPIAEEKEKHTLRVLLLSGVRPVEFLVGDALTTVIIGLASHTVLFFLCGAPLAALPLFLLTGLLGMVAAASLGAVIGVSCKNTVSASIASLPFMLALLLLPMFGQANTTLETIANCLFTTASSNVMAMSIMGAEGTLWRELLIMAANIAVFIVLFTLVYRRNRLDD